MKCPKCNTGELRSNSMLGHNWTCDLCGYTQWSATLNAPGSDSYSSGGSIYSGTDSYSSGNILGNYTPEMPMTYSLGHKETQLDILTPKIIEELKKSQELSEDMEKIKKESDPEKRRAMVARAQKELDEREKETKKLSKKIKKLKKSQKVSLGDVIAGIILILLLLYFFV